MKSELAKRGGKKLDKGEIPGSLDEGNRAYVLSRSSYTWRDRLLAAKAKGLSQQTKLQQAEKKNS